MDDRTRLADLLVDRSVRLGDFTLASGRRSHYYVDARRTTMSAEGQFLLGRVGWTALQDRDWSFGHVGGLTLGADPVAYALAHRSWMEGVPVDAFSVRKEAKGHGTASRIEGGLPEGSTVLLVEDTVTTGGSALDAASVLREHGCAIAGVFAVVDRDEGGAARLHEAGLELLALFSGPELLERTRRAVAPKGAG